LGDGRRERKIGGARKSKSAKKTFLRGADCPTIQFLGKCGAKVSQKFSEKSSKWQFSDSLTK